MYPTVPLTPGGLPDTGVSLVVQVLMVAVLIVGGLLALRLGARRRSRTHSD
jgi:hypothetical protein